MKEIAVVNNREVHLQAYVWEPDELQSDKALFFVHSYGDSGYRYNWLAHVLTRKGWTVCTFDLPSHGRSGGLRAKWASLDDLIEDVHYMIKWFQYQYTLKVWYGLGLGFGANLLTLVTKQRVDITFSGLALWAPLSKLSTRFPKVLLDSINYVKSFTSHLTVLTLHAEQLSGDTERLYSEIPDWDDDFGKVSAKTAGILMDAASIFVHSLSSLSVPIWVGWAKKDQFSDSQWFEKQWTKPQSSVLQNIQLTAFDDGFHYVEPDKTGFDMIHSFLAWIDSISIAVA